jgi:putative transcriptional regulator
METDDIMGNDYPETLKGQFLISMPGMADPNFASTVTCICEHTTDGAIGLVINRVHDAVSCKEIFDELDIDHTAAAGRMPVHIGGPVHLNELFILHGPPFGWDGCLMIDDDLAMSNTPDILEAIAGERGPELALVVIGCAGWGPLQLESEIRDNAWISGPLSPEIIFEAAVKDRWKMALRRLGIDPALLSDTAGHA